MTSDDLESYKTRIGSVIRFFGIPNTVSRSIGFGIGNLSYYIQKFPDFLCSGYPGDFYSSDLGCFIKISKFLRTQIFLKIRFQIQFFTLFRLIIKLELSEFCEKSYGIKKFARFLTFLT